jgi:Tfp pilus assembly protein PilX
MKIIAEDASSFHGKFSRKRGIAMFTALFVMIIIGMLAVQFHYMSRQAQSDAFRFQASEIARQLAESAMDEAFLYIYQQTQGEDGEFFNDIVSRSSAIDCSSMSLANKDSKGKDVNVDLTVAQAADIKNGEKFNISATARIIDFRDTDSSTDGKYYKKEGIGTLEIKVSVTPKDEYKRQIKSSCHITRHHDYKVVSMISDRDNGSQRTEYAQNYVLDYALFIRNGQQEFDSTQGMSLNPEKWNLTIDQTGLSFAECGKICLGNTPGNYVYLNIDEERKDFIPTPVDEPEILVVNDSATDNIFPTLKGLFEDKVEEKVDDEGADLDDFDMYGHQGYFCYKRFPITDDGINEADYIDYRLLTNTGKMLQDGISEPVPNFFSGIKVLPEDNLSDFFEGDVRQRFFHLGYFYVELIDCVIKIEWDAGLDDGDETHRFGDPANFDQVEKFRNRLLPVFDNEQINLATNNLAANNPTKYPLLFDYIANNYTDSYPDIPCAIPEEYSYNQDPEHDYPQPKFFQYRSTSISDSPLSASVPYAHVNLWARRNLTIDMIKEFGIYDPDNKKLNLRGIVQLAEPLEIGESGGPIEVNGQGVIIAPGITISSGIKKANDDSLCVLVTRGYPIEIKTSELIEASLVSLGRSYRGGHIKALETLNLKGSLAVDMLRLDKWKEGVDHKIEYDPALKPGEDMYQVNISRWVSFQRMVEND